MKPEGIRWKCHVILVVKGKTGKTMPKKGQKTVKLFKNCGKNCSKIVQKIVQENCAKIVQENLGIFLQNCEKNC